MSSKQTQRWIYLGALVGSFLYLLIAMLDALPLPFDEGIVVSGAEQILHGKVPYRDFAAYYTPGQIYSLAAVFHVFGPSLLAERIWDTCMRLALCVLVFLVARTLTSRRLAIIPFTVVLLFLGWCGFPGYPVIPAMVWALAAVYLLIRHHEDRKGWRLLLAGVAVGVCAFYRQDVGTYAFVSGAVLLLVPLSGISLGQVAAAKFTSRWKHLLCYAAGACIVWFPVLAYFFWKVPARNLWADFVKFPHLQMQYRHLPLPPVVPAGSSLLAGLTKPSIWFLFYVPLVVFLVFTVKLLRGVFRATPESGSARQRFAILLLTVFGLSLVITASTRADSVHFLAPTIPAAILFALLLHLQSRRRVWIAATLALSLVVLGVPYIMAPLVQWGLGVSVRPPWSGASSLSRARYLHVPADQEAAVRFIRAHVPSGDPIFVGNAQNRRVFANDVIFYFLANRPPGTRHEEYEPGVVTTVPVQRQIIAELERNHVHWAVLFSGFESEAEAEAEPDSRIGAGVLDSYLARSFRPVCRVGSYTLLQSEGLPSSALRSRPGVSASLPLCTAGEQNEGGSGNDGRAGR